MLGRFAPLHLVIPIAVTLGGATALWGHIRANGILEEVLALRAEAEAIDGFLLQLARGQSAIRGYLLFGDGPRLEEAIAELQRLDTPEAQATARRIDSALALPPGERMEEALAALAELRREVVAVALTEGAPAILASARPAAGVRLMGVARTGAERHKALLLERTAAAKASLLRALDTVLWTVLASALLSLGALAATWRQHRERARAEAATRAALARSGAELATLREIGEILQACDTPEEVARVARHAAERLVPGIGLALFAEEDPEAEELSGIGAWGLPAPPALPRGGCWALKRGRANEAGSAAVCELCAPVGGLCVPLQARGQRLGALWAAGRALSAEEARLVAALADQLALALGAIRLREELRAQALRDPLTGLNNRRFLDEVGDKLCQQALRRGGPLAVLMVDLDHFKAINDAHGHAAGDAVLRRAGQLMAQGLRRSDICCRYGGEEFAVLLVDCSLENAAMRAEQLRRRIEREPEVRGVPAVTASFGVAALPQCGSSLAELLRAADEALYRAKAAGRNRVETAAPPGPPALRLAAGAD